MRKWYSLSQPAKKRRHKMEEIKKFLRLMDKEALVDLCASMLFTQLATMVDLEKALKMLHKE